MTTGYHTQCVQFIQWIYCVLYSVYCAHCTQIQYPVSSNCIHCTHCTQDTVSSSQSSLPTVLMQQHILPGAESKLQHILLLQFIVALALNPGVVQEGSIGRAKVYYIREHLVRFSPIIPFLADKPILKYSMLFTGTGVVNGEVTHLSISSMRKADCL